MKRKLLSLMVICIYSKGFSQTEKYPYYNYWHIINKAELCNATNKLDSALFYYNKAFKTKEAEESGLRHATRIAVKLDSTKYLPSYLKKLIAFGYDSSYINKNYIKELTAEEAKIIKEKSYNNYDSIHNAYLKGSNQPLHDTLIEMAKDDQYYRASKHGLNDSLWAIELKKTDIKNFKIITRMAKQYGWPTYKMVGSASGLFNLILLHGSRRYPGDNEDWLFFQRLMKKEVENGELSPITLGQWIDGHLIYTEKKSQIYGTDWDLKNKLCPIEDIENVNKRRDEVGLGSLEDYMIIHNLTK